MCPDWIVWTLPNSSSIHHVFTIKLSTTLQLNAFSSCKFLKKKCFVSHGTYSCLLFPPSQKKIKSPGPFRSTICKASSWSFWAASSLIPAFKSLVRFWTISFIILLQFCILSTGHSFGFLSHAGTKYSMWWYHDLELSIKNFSMSIPVLEMIFFSSMGISCTMKHSAVPVTAWNTHPYLYQEPLNWCSKETRCCTTLWPMFYNSNHKHCFFEDETIRCHAQRPQQAGMFQSTPRGDMTPLFYLHSSLSFWTWDGSNTWKTDSSKLAHKLK